MNTKNKQITRPASIAHTQGNQTAKLIKADGNEPTEQETSSDAPAPMFPLLDLSLFRFEIPSESDEGADGIDLDGAENGSMGLSFSRYAMLEARDKSDGNIQNYIDYCEAAYKGLKKAAEALISPHMETYMDWIKQFKTGAAVKLAVPNRNHALTLEEDEFDRSAKAIAYAMAKISNTLLFGKPATEGKAKVESIFYNPKKVAKLGGFIGGNTKLRAMANVEHLIVDGDGQMEFMFTQIGLLAKQILHHNQVEATDTWRRLTGQVVADRRVVMDAKHLADWTQARMFGSMAAMFAEEGRKAKEKKFRLMLSDAEQARLLEYRRNQKIALNKAEDTANEPKVEKIAGSNVESPNSKATLPTAMIAPKTLEDIQLNRAIKLAGKQAEAEMHEAITKGELNGDDLEACQAFWEAANIRILEAASETPDAETIEETSDAETPESNS